MPRLVNGERKIMKPRPENAGKLLIFCEGATEFNYLQYFKNYIDNNLRAKYSDIVIEPINVKGNAMHVYKFAETFLQNETNASRFLYYEKHLVFDCDAPDNIQDVITLMRQSDNNYILDYSNLLFETWLVMHFQNIMPDGAVDKRSIIRQLREYLDVIKYTDKVKAAQGTIGKILGSNGNERIRVAVQNAVMLEKHWEMLGFDENKDIQKMNPSVSIYKLIERLLDEVVYLCG